MHNKHCNNHQTKVVKSMYNMELEHPTIYRKTFSYISQNKPIRKKEGLCIHHWIQ